jgi:hypothetical protein
MITATTHTKLIQQIKAARRVSTPLVAITTSDPAATIESLCESAGFNGAPKLMWDCVMGLSGRGDESKPIVAEMAGDHDSTVGNPVELLTLAMAKMPKNAVLFMHMAHRFLHEPAVVQAIWNLRDKFKMNTRTLYMLAPSIDLPEELAGDVIVFDEPLPDAAALTQIIRDQHEAADHLALDESIIGPAVEAVQGLPAFQAEQVVAMSLSRNGLDVPALWERKRRQIELTPGLKVHRDGVRFDGIGGVDSVKGFLKRIMAGQARPNAVVFIDEIEKMLAGSSGAASDSSGVSQDQLGSLLTYMQDHGAAGMIFVGPPGSAKSMVAKAAGNEGGIPTIQLDLGGMKGSLVGQSEQQLRAALKVITSVSNGRTLWIATCNAIGDLPPELRRRFTLGTFFFDLPEKPEREVIWRLHAQAFGIADSKRPEDHGWTGAEIRQCCDIAWRLGITLKEAAAYVVPVSRSASETIDRLRKAADGRFLSASKGGIYSRPEASSNQPTGPAGKSRRQVNVEE